jgi:hypothetical protein
VKLNHLQDMEPELLTEEEEIKEKSQQYSSASMAH